ncbi:MAG: hypothetical protein NVSMB57_02940 [Actinomycetota bacterium]
MRAHMLNAQLDHVAVAVRDIRSSMHLYCDALGATFLFAGDQHEQAFRFAQFQFPNGGKIELVTPLGDGFVQRFLDSRGEGVHHVTLKTNDIHASIAHLRSQNVPLFGISLNDEQWKEVFIHPRDGHGVLMQVAQSAWGDEEMARHHLSDHENSGHTHVSQDDL